MTATRLQDRAVERSVGSLRRSVYSLYVVNTMLASYSVTDVMSLVRVGLLFPGGGSGLVDESGGKGSRGGGPPGVYDVGQPGGGGGGPLRSEILVRWEGMYGVGGGRIEGMAGAENGGGRGGPKPRRVVSLTGFPSTNFSLTMARRTLLFAE